MLDQKRSCMDSYQFDPVEDPRWPEFLERHPRACVFHTPGWLEALRRTYGYEPIGYTSSPPRRKNPQRLGFLPDQQLADGSAPGVFAVL